MTTPSELYHSGLFRSCIESVERLHPQADVPAILETAGIDSRALTNESAWFSQETLNRFHKGLLDQGLPQNILFRASCHAVAHKKPGIFNRLHRLMHPRSNFFQSIEDSMRRGTRGHTITLDDRKANSFCVSVRSKEGVKEQLGQCEGRHGTLITLSHTHLGPCRLTHPRCMHRGDPECVYHISVEKMPFSPMRRFLPLITLICFLAALLLPLVFSPLATALGALSLLSLTLILWVIMLWGEKNRLLALPANMQDDAFSAMAASREKHDIELLFHEMGAAGDQVTDEASLLLAFMHSIRTRLPFGRGILL
ncbi:hypothetical protein KJ865_07210, partial [Myxococcota bacterium]|nr:hypothetical protein [Myxococcota bacterium]